MLFAALVLPAEIIDRIAISVGNQVITESQIEEELQVTAFLNREKLDLSALEKKQAAARLIEQTLVKREMEFSRYPLPAAADADEPLKSVASRYTDPTLYQAALRQYGIDEDVLKRRLLWQLTLLRFVDYRFRSGIQLQDSDVQAYYQQQVVKWRQQGVQPIPTQEDARGQIEEILTQQRIDQSLETWLTETRTQVAIRYRDETLQ